MVVIMFAAIRVARHGDHPAAGTQARHQRTGAAMAEQQLGLGQSRLHVGEARPLDAVETGRARAPLPDLRKDMFGKVAGRLQRRNAGDQPVERHHRPHRHHCGRGLGRTRRSDDAERIADMRFGPGSGQRRRLDDEVRGEPAGEPAEQARGIEAREALDDDRVGAAPAREQQREQGRTGTRRDQKIGLHRFDDAPAVAKVGGARAQHLPPAGGAPLPEGEMGDKARRHPLGDRAAERRVLGEEPCVVPRPERLEVEDLADMAAARGCQQDLHAIPRQPRYQETKRGTPTSIGVVGAKPWSAAIAEMSA
jgi:hypothetical protein